MTKQGELGLFPEGERFEVKGEHRGAQYHLRRFATLDEAASWAFELQKTIDGTHPDSSVTLRDRRCPQDRSVLGYWKGGPTGWTRSLRHPERGEGHR